MKIALAQYDPVWENKDLSQIRITALLEKLENDISLIVFPELTLTGFTMRSKRFGESPGGNTVKFFSRLADKHTTHIMAGYIEAEGDAFYNTLVHFNNKGEIVTKYRKIHPFTYTGEDRHYNSGTIPAITKIGDISIGMTICYDLRFPELYRRFAKEKVDLLVNSANWPEGRIDHWYALLKARAIENQAYIVGVNRVGEDKANRYTGWSTAFQPDGREIVCVKNETALAYARINKSDIMEIRSKFPFLNDMKLI